MFEIDELEVPIQIDDLIEGIQNFEILLHFDDDEVEHDEIFVREIDENFDEIDDEVDERKWCVFLQAIINHEGMRIFDDMHEWHEVVAFDDDEVEFELLHLSEISNVIIFNKYM